MNDNGKTPFPFKLFQMLEEAHGPRGFSHIVSWNPNGTVFKVHDTSAFMKCVAPKYFKQTRYKSFQVCVTPISHNEIIPDDIFAMETTEHPPSYSRPAFSASSACMDSTGF